MSYFYLRVDSDIKSEKISFIRSPDEEQPKRTYHTSSSRIFLRSINTHTKFIDFNSSLCYTNGTDLVSMKRSKEFNWQCACLPGWHGKDCGQPEVIWRAFLTHRTPIKIIGPRSFERRIIYAFAVDKFSEIMTEIRINELGDIVDLFILYEDEESDFLERKLNNNFVKNYHEKILYLKAKNIKYALRLVRNLRDDDVILTSERNEVPNKYAIIFLKYYDKWPEPVRFRMRWSVFGFFWLHPGKTIITGGACSVSFLRANFNNKFGSLHSTSSPLNKGIILGDLNHFGGWFCEYCNDVAQIIEFLSSKPQTGINLEKIAQKKIDNAFLEDVIENGLYIDGKTELLRTHRYRDNYFAPFYVSENSWAYDFLLTNIYSKIDYYEG
ncbi:Beta-1,4-mannosyl-glycoprotein 4-beta-N-acetylglucosaminyltransferase-like Protein [Tribolium castaneum]|uniref:Beta-1,4-mannosyl-glycoprotein 4-beta-N-acetylglucosaminyltransferase-like Protein n=2 Tax=Tribolium castaneum TaxID=7070 RepID=D2A2H4_TRICA|nr:Beta-1,4-mannosyl-glycoprotein 4-beta-N-acetylglucosaminyltransferase-like Protein [Tribolium castaneum]